MKPWRNAQPGSADPPSPTDEVLLERLSRDPSALATLYDRYGGLVYGIALRALGSVDDAKDLTQEVFLGLRERSTYDAARGTLAAYLTTVTRTRAIDQLRFGTRKVRLLRHWWVSDPAPEGPRSAAEQIDLETSTARVRAALADLSEQERQVIELAYFKGLSQSEIAEAVGAPLGSVKSWSRRALLRLRSTLTDLVE